MVSLLSALKGRGKVSPVQTVHSMLFTASLLPYMYVGIDRDETWQHPFLETFFLEKNIRSIIRPHGNYICSRLGVSIALSLLVGRYISILYFALTIAKVPFCIACGIRQEDCKILYSVHTKLRSTRINQLTRSRQSQTVVVYCTIERSCLTYNQTVPTDVFRFKIIYSISRLVLRHCLFGRIELRQNSPFLHPG